MPCYDPPLFAATYETADALKRERNANEALYGVDATNEGVARAVACELGRLIAAPPHEKPAISDMAQTWLHRHEAQDAARLKSEEAARLVLANLREKERCRDCDGAKEAHIFSEALSAAGGGVRCVCAMPDAAYCGCRGYVARGTALAGNPFEICANCGQSRSRHDWRGERRGCDGFLGAATDG